MINSTGQLEVHSVMQARTGRQAVCVTVVRPSQLGSHAPQWQIADVRHRDPRLMLTATAPGPHLCSQIEGQPAIPIRMVYNRAEGKVHIEG